MRKKGSELELVSIRSAKCCEILLNHEADPDIRDNHDLTALHYACASNNISSYSVLHSTTAKLDPRLLLLSSLNGSYDMVKRLLADYPESLWASSTKVQVLDKTQLDKTKNTRPNQSAACDGIYLAAMRDNVQVLEIFADHYEGQLMQNPNAIREDTYGKGPLGKNAFHMAAINANHQTFHHLEKLVAPLAGNAADISKILVGDAYGCTPLHYAAIVGRDESMDPLLDMAQNESSQFMFSIIEKTDLRGRTIFHYACYTNADDIMVNLCQRLDKIRLRKCLLMPDRDGLTPLHFAVKRNHINLARQILSICPETVNSYDKRGLTPFVLAILIGADQIVDLVFNLHNSKSVSLSDMNGKCFMAAATVGHAKLLNKLKENFCQENTEVGYQWFRQTCHKGRTPLHHTCRRNHSICLNLLLAISKTLTGSFNDELIQKDKYGMNALHIAVENGSTDVVKELLQIDNNGQLLGVGEGSAGNSALQMAILKSDESLAELILRFCNVDDINHRNFKGETALHQATVNGLGLTERLLTLGADAFVFDDRGRLPLFAHSTTQGGLNALYDIFEHMLKSENKHKLHDLMNDDELNESDASSTRYVTTADLSVSEHVHVNGRLSFHTSLPSQRRSLSSTMSSNRHSNQHQNIWDENERRSNASSRNRRSDLETDEVFNDVEAF